MTGRETGRDPLLQHAVRPHSVQPRVTDELEVVPGFERENLQGWIPELATEADIRAVIEKAFDYRGDVTVSRKDGSQITGYLFDRRVGPALASSVIRLMPGDSLFRDRRHRLHRPRHRRRQELRSLGQEVLGEARKGRDEHFDRAGSAGVVVCGANALARGFCD